MYNSSSQIKRVKYTLIVAAAGSGKRMGLQKKKQFLEFRGKPLYMSSLIIGENSKVIDEIIIVTAEEDVEVIRHQCNLEGFKKIKNIVSGGKERQDSIYNALKFCEDGLVAIQDGARPFLQETYLIEGKKLLLKEENLSGVVVGVKVKDTIKKVNLNTEIIEITPERDELYMAQTPQIFKVELLKKAYEDANKVSYYGTDDSSLVEKNGGVVKIIEGSYNNIKITTIEDLRILSGGKND